MTRRLKLGYRRALTVRPGRWQAAALGPWWTGPWSGRFRDVPAIPAENVIIAYQPHWGVGSFYERADAASYANSKVNLADPGTYDAVEGVAPLWAADFGWDFVVRDPAQYLETGYTPAQTDGLFAHCSANTDGLMTSTVVGCESGGNTRLYVMSSAAGGVVYGCGGYVIQVPPLAQEQAVIGVYRSGCYRRGEQEATISQGFEGPIAYTLNISRRNGATPSNGDQGIQAVLVVSEISSEQIMAVTAAMSIIGGA